MNDREKKQQRTRQSRYHIRASSDDVTEYWKEPQHSDHIDSSAQMKVVEHLSAFDRIFVPSGILNNATARDQRGDQCHSIKKRRPV
mmetsp:Transcript_56169/g.114617  ORF Transcript_56169/g.114617 Transcript_56169/m.114617 type:complete len:86 (-) Transcript_56169:414-671(-)